MRVSVVKILLGYLSVDFISHHGEHYLQLSMLQGLFFFFFFNLGLKKYMCFSHLVLINTKEEIFYGQKCLVVIRCSSNSVPHSLK